MNRDVAIVGMGCRFPQAADLGAYWRNICDARVCFSEVPAERWNHALFYDPSPRAIDKTYARKVGFVDDVRAFAALHYGLAPLRVAVMDPQHRLLLDAVRVALEDAGRGEATLAGTRTGVFVGASVSEYKDLVTSRLRARAMLDGQFGRAPRLPAEFADAIIEDVMPLRAFSIAGNLLNMAAATVAQTFDLRGPAFTIDAACSSSLVAAYDAVLYLRAGVCDVAVAGGVYLNLTPDNLVGFSRIGAISPSDACRPFDDRADGFVLGEGAGAVVMKRLDDALRDGDRIYAVIRGAGINNDGRGEGPMTPRPEGQLDAIERAHAELEFSPDAIGFVEAHGTATAVGDATEVGALRRYFERHARGPIACALSSVKANIGHTMSAAGVAGLIKAALVLDKATIPAQAAFAHAHGKLGLAGSGFHVPTATAPFPVSPGQPRRAAVSSFGFGGTNCHLVLEEAPPRRAITMVAVTAPGPEAFFVSAPSAELLDVHLGAIGEAINDAVPLSDLARTLATRAREQARVGFTARTHDELRQRLRIARDVVRGGAAPPGLWFAAAPHPEADRRIAFVFPGQGAQAIGMARALYDRFPVFRVRLDTLAGALDDLLARPLLTYLYPPREGASGDEAAALRALTATEICQPAMAALGLAIAGFAEELGIVPSVVAGHSLGEFAALGAAGVISARDTVRFVAQRGRLMSSLPLVDPGAMAAVQADRAFVEARIAGTPEVVIANVNHPKQTVISGATDAVLAASARLAADGATVTRLAVSHAFHSPLIAPADPAIGALVGALAIDLANRPANRIAISCIEPGPYPEDVAAIRRILRRHATSTVDFVAGVRAVAAAGAKVIVQVAAGTTLLSMARASLRTAEIVPVAAISLSGTGSDDAAQLLEASTELAVIGVPVALAALASPGARLTWLPPTPLPTESYWCATRSDRERPPLPVLSVGGEGRSSASGDDVIALFHEQMQVLQTHAEIMRAQAEALAGTGTLLPSHVMPPLPREVHRIPAPRATLPAPAPLALTNGHDRGRPHELAAAPGSEPFAAPVSVPPAAPAVESFAARVPVLPAAPVAVSSASLAPASLELAVDVGDKLFGLVAQVSAFPRDKLVPSQRLISDLGFDSLMVVELSGKLTDAFAGFKGLPKTLFASEPTIADVIQHVQHVLGDAGRARLPVANEAPGAITRYVATPVARPLTPMPHGAIPPFAGPITILADAGGVAAQVATRLASRLGAAGVTVEIGDRLTDRPTHPRGVIDLRALGAVGAVGRDPFTLDAATLRVSVDRAFDVARALGAHVSPASPASLFAVVYAGDEHAAVAGFGHALAREWPETRVKAIRVDATIPADRLAAQIFDELVGSDTAVEVAYPAGTRQVIELSPAAASDPRPLRDGAVVAITGGARGLGAKIAQELARRHHARLVLLGRSASADDAIAAIAAAGGQAIYVSCDVRDPAAVAAALDHGRRRFGPIEAVVHAAGVIADAPLARKDPAAIAAVFDTKAFGWISLERATRGDPLQIVLALGSWSGRFGNAEQTDYAAANHLVATLAAAWHRTRPSTRVVALDLPPWDGSAMAATIPAGLRAMMRARGVTFLDDATGLAVVAGELVAGGGAGEILVGHDVATAREDHVQIRLGLDTHPYLGDHRIGGVPVLPLAAAADLALAAAGRLVGARAGLAELELIEGIRLEQDRPITIDVRARAELSGGVLGPVELEIATSGRLAYRARSLTDQAPLPELGALAALTRPAVLEPPPLALEEFYARHTFHGPRLRGIVRITGLDELHIAGVVRSARPGDLYPRGPNGPSGTFALDPLVIDASFQLAAYFMLVRHGRAGLPLGFDELRVLAPFEAGEAGEAGAPVSCLVRLEAQAGDLVIGHIDYRDAGGRLVAQLRGVRGQFRATERLREATEAIAVGKPNGHAAPAAGKSNGSSHGPVEPPRPIPPPLVTPAEPAREVPPALATPSQIDPACYDIAAFPEVTALRARIAEVLASGLDLPYFNLHERVTSDTTVIAGREMINFSAYNYLGLSGHPAVSRAAIGAIERYGTSVSASRIASGEKPLHRELEAEIARFLGCEDAIVMVGGHATNVSVVGHLVGPGDLVLHDSLAHDSILGGIKLSGARRRPFPHNDWRALDAALDAMRGAFRRVLIVIEGVYSMDGDIPELPRFIEIKRRHKALLMIDEAHSLGVLGARGAGVGEQFGVDRRDVDIWMGTLSKSLASCGGYVAGSHALVEYLKYTNPGFVYSVGISPPNAAAALAALDELERHPELVATLQARSALFLALCREREIDTGLSGGSAVVPCIVGDSVRSMLIAQALAQVGINVQPIIYPAVEEHLARLRFFITARHTEAQLRYTANMLAQVNATFNRTPSPRKSASPSTAPLD